MIHVVIDLLKDDSAVTGMVPANSIMPVKGEQTVERPHIIVDLLSTDLDRTKEGMVFETYNIEVFIASVGIYNAWQIHERCRLALDNFSDSTYRVTDRLGPYDIKIIRLADISTDAHELDDFFIIRSIYALEMDKWDGSLG